MLIQTTASGPTEQNQRNYQSNSLFVRKLNTFDSTNSLSWGVLKSKKRGLIFRGRGIFPP